jgi:hypothetical protein
MVAVAEKTTATTPPVVASVVASAQPVVASVVASPQPVVASREKPDATTDRATTDRATTSAPRNATTSRPALVWRIEINRRRKASNGWSYHWLYRFGSGNERRSVYGGTIDQLMALNLARWQKYLEVTNGKAEQEF